MTAGLAVSNGSLPLEADLKAKQSKSKKKEGRRLQSLYAPNLH